LPVWHFDNSAGRVTEHSKSSVPSTRLKGERPWVHSVAGSLDSGGCQNIFCSQLQRYFLLCPPHVSPAFPYITFRKARKEYT
jgi:hypothetical protein